MNNCPHKFEMLHEKARWCPHCDRVEMFMREASGNDTFKPPKWHEVDAGTLASEILKAIDGRIEQHTMELYRLNKLREKYTG